MTHLLRVPLYLWDTAFLMLDSWYSTFCVGYQLYTLLSLMRGVYLLYIACICVPLAGCGCGLFPQPTLYIFAFDALKKRSDIVTCGCSLDLWGSILSLLLLTDSCPFGIYFCNRFTLFSAFYILALYCLLRTGSPCHLAGNSGSPLRGSVCVCLLFVLRQVPWY